MTYTKEVRNGATHESWDTWDEFWEHHADDPNEVDSALRDLTNFVETAIEEAEAGDASDLRMNLGLIEGAAEKVAALVRRLT